MFYNRQPQPRPAKRATAVAVGAVEPFGQARQVDRVDPRPVIADRDPYSGASQRRVTQCGLYQDFDLFPHPTVFNAVFNKVREHLQQLVRVAHQRQRIVPHRGHQRHICLYGQGVKIAHGRLQHIAQINLVCRTHSFV